MKMQNRPVKDDRQNGEYLQTSHVVLFFRKNLLLRVRASLMSLNVQPTSFCIVELFLFFLNVNW